MICGIFFFTLFPSSFYCCTLRWAELFKIGPNGKKYEKDSKLKSGLKIFVVIF